MAGFFRKNDKKRRHPQRPERVASGPRRKPTSDHDLVDPIAYNGDLDAVKYPVLEPKKTETQEFEPENPLNTRR